MYRLIILSLSTLYLLNAQTYQELLTQALQNNVTLQIAQSKERAVMLEGAIKTRRKNPNLELEVSDYLELGSNRFNAINDFGVKAGVTQELLLPKVKKDIEHLTQAKIKVANQNHKLLKSEFIYRFTLYYLEYKNRLKKRLFLKEALGVSNEILETVQLHYEHGAIPKSEFLQSRLNTRELLNQIDELNLQIAQKKDAFFSFANIKSSQTINTSYAISLKNRKAKHPFIQLKEQEQALSNAKLKLLSHPIESIELFSEIEKEPNEDIFRVGISIPLPLYNHKSQEKELVKIERNQQQLQQKSQERLLNIKLEQLKNRQEQISQAKEQYQKRLEEQEQLFLMYKQGYEVAKVNLIELQKSQQQRIKIQKKIAILEMKYKKNIVKINYLRGAYSE